MQLTPGTRLGVYEVTALLGEGGMGQVYRARDTKLNRDVAVKVLPESFADDPDRLARFQREAQTLAALNHPNIAQIHGLEESGGVRALVMELVEGDDLSQRLRRGPIPVDEALLMARQVAEALEAAHEQGIVHRDLKPANIKVRPDGMVKVLDFGLAKALEPAAAMSGSRSMSPTITTPAMTQAGVILGTAAYMSPEQARGKPLDRRADIWAFGCVLFEMLTGRRAFDAEDVSLTLAEVMKSEPDWTAVPALPPAVRVCLRRCLKKDPRRRLRDIGEARLALEGALDDDIRLDAVGAAPSPSRRVWAWVLPFAAASALAAAAATVWLRPERPSPLPQVVRFEIRAPAGSKIPPGTPAFSPDGRTLAYVVTDANGTNRIHLRGIDAMESRPLPGTEQAQHLFWSGDGRSIAFSVERSLRRIDLAGGLSRELVASVVGPWHGSWNQFGDVLFLGPQVSRVNAEGGAPVPVVALDAKAGETSSSFPAFLPDGRRFLVRISRADGGSALHLASLDSADRKLILEDVTSAAIVAPTPAGTTFLLYLRDEGLVAQEFDVASGAVRGASRLLVDGVGRMASPPLRPSAGASASGAIAYQTGGDSTTVDFTWFSRSGQRLSGVSLEVAGANSVLSPDGRLLAMDADLRGNRDIWVTDLARGVTSRLTSNPASDLSPTWSPDGKRLAFLRSGKIYVKDSDGSGEETLLAEVFGAPRSWSADGRYLLCALREGRLLLWPLTGGGPPVPVGAREGFSRNGQFSRDGQYLVYSSNEAGREDVYLQAVPPATGRIKLSASGGSQPRWGPDNREVFFIGGDRPGMLSGEPTIGLSGDRSMMIVDVTTKPALTAGVPRKLFPIGLPTGFVGFDVSPDGQRLLINKPREDLPDTPITIVLNWWAEFVKRN